MSFYRMTTSMYRPPPPGAPGWQLAPVPGWGMNPERSGPPIIATNGLSGCDCEACKASLGAASCGACCGGLSGEGDKYRTMTEGHVALAAAAGIAVGWFLSYVYFTTRKRR